MCPFANLDPNLGPNLDPDFGPTFINKNCKYLTQFKAVSSTSLFFFLFLLFLLFYTATGLPKNKNHKSCVVLTSKIYSPTKGVYSSTQ